MISTGICKIIFYKQTDTMSYVLSNMYDICVGTPISDLGLSNQMYFDISTLTKSSFNKINISPDSLSLTYEFPKIIGLDLQEFMCNCNLYKLSDVLYIDKPTIILIDNDFNYDMIKEYINTYSEYGVKEYPL